MADDALTAYVPRLLLAREHVAPSHWEQDGTLVFADVSGFTRLTEKLSRDARAGSEEIVRTVSDVFTVLLTAAADGGDVLKFSGDAMLLLFDSADHARRACHAALAMQRVLRAVGGIDSSRGRVRLRMSMGIHTGRLSFFLCGGDHLELFTLGPAASTAVAAERVARAGEVRVSAATAAAVPDATFGASHGDTVALRSMPALQPSGPPLPPPEPPDVAAATRARRHVPPPLRDRLASGEPEHEHRRATVAFAHFGRVDDLLAAAGATAAFDRVQSLTEATMRAVEEHGVLLTATDVATGGGTFMLTAGAPDATGDDAARMLRVARRMLDADHGLPVRIGVHAGDLFVGAVGTPWRRTYSTMGAAANLAARIMGAAPWGGALATTAVLDEVGPRVVATPVPPLQVKGHAMPVAAGLVERVANTVTTADRSVPFAGRRRELAVLTAALAAARGGRGGAVEIVGDPGVGKSRLVDELRATAGDVAWFHTAGDPYEATSPYHASGALVRQVLGIPGGATRDDAVAALTAAVAASASPLQPWLPLIAAAATIDDVCDTSQSAEVAPRYRRDRTHQVVGELLSAVLVDPAVIVIDDAQHVDDASAELTAALIAERLPHHPWLILVVRTDAATGLHAGRGYDATALPVAPLDRPTAAGLAARLAEHTPVAAHALGDVVERAGGNPLFLAALVAAQSDGGAALPHSIEAMIAARIDGLDPHDRRALRYLSVLGERFDAELLDTVLAPQGVGSGQTDRWHRLAEFIAADGDAFAFRNPLVRQVAYDGLPFRRRRQLHARVADALDAGVAPARLSLHLLRAERWADAWRTARRAADDAQARGANAVAGELYDMAVRAARRAGVPDADVAAAAIAAGDVWQRAGMGDRALGAYSVAAGAATDARVRADITLRRARVHEAAGRHPQALRLYRRVLSGATQLTGDAERHRCLAAAHAGYASARLGQARASDAVAHATEAAAHARRAGDDATLARAHHLLDRAHTALGDETAAAEHRDRALPVFAALGDLASQGTVLHDLGAAAHRAGRLDAALWLFERSHEVRARVGDVVRTAASANAIGEVLLELGRTDDAHAHFAAALRAWRGARSPRGIAQATRNLGVVALRRGDHAGAVELLDEAAELARRVGAVGLHDAVQLPLAEALLAVGRYVEAWDAAGRCADGADTMAASGAHRVRGEALLRTGGRIRARDELTRAVTLADRVGDDAAAGAALRLLGQLDHPDGRGTTARVPGAPAGRCDDVASGSTAGSGTRPRVGGRG